MSTGDLVGNSSLKPWYCHCYVFSSLRNAHPFHMFNYPTSPPQEALGSKAVLENEDSLVGLAAIILPNPLGTSDE